MECNIDAQGKAARLIGGIAGLAFGVVMTSLLVLDVLNGLVASSAAAGAILAEPLPSLRQEPAGAWSGRWGSEPPSEPRLNAACGVDTFLPA